MHWTSGDHENLNTSGNPGNFLALLNLIGQYDQTVKGHLDRPALKNATYISPMIQNEIINIIGINIIKKSICDEVREAKFFSILADEVTSHNTEIVVLCVRFVDKEFNIREEFLNFSKVHMTTGTVVSKEILQVPKDINSQLRMQ